MATVKRVLLGSVIIIGALGWGFAAYYAYKPPDACHGNCTRQCQDRCFARGYCPAATAD